MTLKNHSKQMEVFEKKTEAIARKLLDAIEAELTFLRSEVLDDSDKVIASEWVRASHRRAKLLEILHGDSKVLDSLIPPEPMIRD